MSPPTLEQTSEAGDDGKVGDGNGAEEGAAACGQGAGLVPRLKVRSIDVVFECLSRRRGGGGE